MSATTRRGRLAGALLLSLTALCLFAVTAVARADFGATYYHGLLQALDSPSPLGTPGTPGTPLLQGGAHPDLSVGAGFTVTTVQTGEAEEGEGPDGNLKDFIGYAPPGLVGDPTNLPTCTRRDLAGRGEAEFSRCSPDSQVGSLVIALYGGAVSETVPLYNMETPPGVPAEFGANVYKVLVFVDARVVDRGGTYTLALETRNVSQALPIVGFRATLWGVPASTAHTPVRAEGDSKQHFGEVESSSPELPFISNPTSCPGTPLLFDGAVATSWQGATVAVPAFSSDEFGRPLVIDGCGRVPFEASFTARPTTAAADSPSGLEATVTIPQSENPNGLSTAHLRDASIRFPDGMTVNAAAANGLGSCSEAEVDLEGEAPAACPQSSRLGTVSIETPLIDRPLEGGVYLASQRENKFGSLLGIYLTIDDPQTGIVLKLPSKIEADASGNLTATFTENPQLPFETLRLSLVGGAMAPLRTPPGCGTYTSTGTFTPWSGGPAVQSSDSFRITSGPEGGPCPSGGFDPTLHAGTVDPVAGKASPFVLEVGRGDGTQGLGSLSATLPEGLLAKLAGVPYCPDSALGSIPTAEGTGATQLASPSCPAASQVGRVSVNVGAGPSPFEVSTGRAYLAGPYKGAPLSLAVVVPALAGPFDLGNVMVRVALRVDSQTTQVTATSDALPTILDGIPLDLRRVSVNLDRLDFTVNPTSCGAAAVTARIDGLGGAVADRSAAYRNTGCAALGFAPKLALAFSGATKRGGDPALTAMLAPKAGEANISRVQVLLPKSAFIDQGHIDNPCTRVQFDAAKCPATSILGTAKAESPLLGKPLEGPVYFRSNGGERQLPDIVADLNGQIHLVLVGFIDSKKGKGSSRVRATFATVPDAPVSKFTLSLKGGKRGLIENSADLCKGKQVATVRAVAHSGKVASFGSRVGASGCGAKKKPNPKH